MLLSKFTAAFFVAGVGLACLTTPSLRRWLVSPAAWAALALAAAIFSPFVLWNAEHGWATFVKQGGRAAASGFTPFFVAEFVVAQICLINPLVFAPLVAAVAAVSWRTPVAPGSADEARRLLAATIAPAAAYFLLHSPARPGAGQLARAALSRRGRSRRRLGRRALRARRRLRNAADRQGCAVGGADRLRGHAARVRPGADRRAAARRRRSDRAARRLPRARPRCRRPGARRSARLSS